MCCPIKSLRLGMRYKKGEYVKVVLQITDVDVDDDEEYYTARAVNKKGKVTSDYVDLTEENLITHVKDFVKGVKKNRIKELEKELTQLKKEVK